MPNIPLTRQNFDEQVDFILDNILRGQVIQAIKRVREVTDLGLLDSKDITDNVQAARHDDLRRIRLIEALTPHITNPATRSVLAWEAMLAVEALDSELTDTRLAQAFRLLADVWAEAKAGGS
jgi:hypothetical protein